MALETIVHDHELHLQGHGLNRSNHLPAQGSRGHLIWTGDNYQFRVYHDQGFTDYDILHSDLEIEIVDPDSAFYDGQILDHSPETLGLK